jgi:acylphosphatase
MAMARAHLFIDGRVQGVFYRAFTRELAYTLGLSGWAKNLRDGRVEAVFEGEKKIIEQAIRECYTGPSGSKVTSIDVEWEAYVGGEQGFSIRYE